MSSPINNSRISQTQLAQEVSQPVSATANKISTPPNSLLLVSKRPAVTEDKLRTEIEKQLKDMETGTKEISASTLNSCLSDIIEPKVSGKDMEQFRGRFNELQKQFRDNGFLSIPARNPVPNSPDLKISQEAREEFQALGKEFDQLDQLGRFKIDGGNERLPIGHPDAKINQKDAPKVQEFFNRVTQFAKKIGLTKENVLEFSKQNPGVMELLTAATALKRDFIKTESKNTPIEPNRPRYAGTSKQTAPPSSPTTSNTATTSNASTPVVKELQTPNVIKEKNGILGIIKNLINNTSLKGSKQIFKAVGSAITRVFSHPKIYEKDIKWNSPSPPETQSTELNGISSSKGFDVTIIYKNYPITVKELQLFNKVPANEWKEYNRWLKIGDTDVPSDLVEKFKSYLSEPERKELTELLSRIFKHNREQVEFTPTDLDTVD